MNYDRRKTAREPDWAHVLEEAAHKAKESLAIIERDHKALDHALAVGDERSVQAEYQKVKKALIEYQSKLVDALNARSALDEVEAERRNEDAGYDIPEHW